MSFETNLNDNVKNNSLLKLFSNSCMLEIFWQLKIFNLTRVLKVM